MHLWGPRLPTKVQICRGAQAPKAATGERRRMEARWVERLQVAVQICKGMLSVGHQHLRG